MIRQSIDRLGDGTEVRVFRTGQPGPEPTAVLVPGLGYYEMLFPLARRLGGWTEAALLDVPGWRSGRATACAPTIAGIASATTAWLRAQAPGPVVLIGHSTGAQAALQAAVGAPDLVRGLVLLGPTIEPAARTWPRLVGRFVRPLWREDPVEFVAIRRSVLAGRVREVTRLIDSALADRPEQWVARLTRPALILAGAHDRVASPGWTRRLARLAGAPAHVLPGGHNFCFPYAAPTDRLVREALRDW